MSMASTTFAPYPRTVHYVPRVSRAGEHRGDMEGTTHAATGMLAGAGIGLLLHAGGHHHGVIVWEDAAQDVLFGMVTAGMALLPDADHPKASFAYSAGFISRGLAHLVSVLFGGHRAGMHSLFGVALFTLLAETGAVWTTGPWPKVAVGAVIAMLIAAGLGATGFARGWTALGIGALAAYAVLHFVPGELWWMVALGMGIHIAEDLCTGHGTALLWPVFRHRIGGDGRQPAGSRSPAKRRPAPRPAGRPAPAGAAKTAPYRTGPWKPTRLSRAMDWTVMCGECLTGEHGECTDRGCKCDRSQHPKRPGGPPVPPAPLPDEPPF